MKKDFLELTFEKDTINLQGDLHGDKLFRATALLLALHIMEEDPLDEEEMNDVLNNVVDGAIEIANQEAKHFEELLEAELN